MEATTTQGQLADLLGVEEHRLEHLRLHCWHLWRSLKLVYAEGADLERWRAAPYGSPEWRWAKWHDEALEVLRVAVED
jgi:hypothetical protein